MEVNANGHVLDRIVHQGLKYAYFPRTRNENPPLGKFEVITIRALVQGYDVERKIAPSSASVQLPNEFQSMLDGDTPITPNRPTYGTSSTSSRNQTNGSNKNGTASGQRRPFTRAASRRASAANGVARGHTAATKPDASSTNYAGTRADKRKGARHGPEEDESAYDFCNDADKDDVSMGSSSILSSLSSKITCMFSEPDRKPAGKKTPSDEKPTSRKSDPKKPDIISVTTANVQEVLKGEVSKKLNNYDITDEIENQFAQVLATLNQKVQNVTVEAIQNQLGAELDRFKGQLYAEQVQQMQQMQQQAHYQMHAQQPPTQIGGNDMNFVTSFPTEDVNVQRIYHLDQMQTGVATAAPNVIEDDLTEDLDI
jgi:hypothetical protein